MQQADTSKDAQAAMEALRGGRRGEAESLARAALDANSNDPLAAEVMGVICLGERRFDEAITHLEAGREAAPDSAMLSNLIGTAYAEQNRLKTALRYFQQATGADPDLTLGWENLGKTAYKLKSWDHARAAFERCLELQPNNMEALTGLARLELLAKNPERALEIIFDAIAEQPNHLACREVLAEAHLRLGNYEKAQAVALGLVRHPGAWPRLRVLAHGIAAEAAEALENYDRAFAHYTAMNDAVAETFRRGVARAENQPRNEKLKEMAAITPLAAEQAARWPNAFDTPAPVFFIGFGHSGMGPVASALLRHPRLISVEGRENVPEWRDLLWADDSPERALALTYDDVLYFRRAYWENVRAAGFVVPESSLAFELKPYYTQHLITFAQVFPDSKYIFAHRDPRDVVLSAFQRRASPSFSLYDFLSLEKAAEYYDLAMSAGWAVREAFDLDITDVGYDDFRADPEAELRRLVSFLGLPWDEAILNGRRPGRRAPPEHKWRAYEKYLAPVRDKLDPWAARFGYE